MLALGASRHGVEGSAKQARELLIAHSIRTLPVVDEADRLVGTLGLRELTLHGDIAIRQVMSGASTARPDDLVVGLIDPLTDGRAHAVGIADENRRVLGIITQTDLLATLTCLHSAKVFAPSDLVFPQAESG